MSHLIHLFGSLLYILLYVGLGLIAAWVATVFFGRQPNPDPLRDDDDLWVW